MGMAFGLDWFWECSNTLLYFLWAPPFFYEACIARLFALPCTTRRVCMTNSYV